jgi:predicted extracellular nuclease
LIVATTRIGTWNLENLFRPGNPAGPTTQAAYDAKLDALAATISALDPDVLAVQEVGDPAALDDLADTIARGYDHRHTATPDRRGIRVGFLSRLPLLDPVEVRDFPAGLRPVQVDDTAAGATTMGRAGFVAGIDIGATRVQLLTCHLKSKLLTFPGGRFSTTDEGERARFAAYALNRRAAEAVTVRTAATGLIDSHGQDVAVIVLGDLNDEATAATTQILQGPPGSEIGTGGFTRPDRGDAERLWNLAAYIPESARYSRTYNGRRELIDHILATARITRELRPGSLIAGPGATSIGDDPSTRRDVAGSDHRPLTLAVDL